MARVRAVERFVAKREIGDDVPLDSAAAGVWAGEAGVAHAGANRTSLQRSGVVVELDQSRKPAPALAEERSQSCDALAAEIDADAAWNHAVAHQAVAETQVGGAQHTLAQDATVGMHERKGSVVTDGTDVAEMIGQALELGHERTQPDGASRCRDLQGGFDGTGEGDGVSDGAVARRAAGEARRTPDIGANH